MDTADVVSFFYMPIRCAVVGEEDIVPYLGADFGGKVAEGLESGIGIGIGVQRIGEWALSEVKGGLVRGEQSRTVGLSN